MQLNQIGKRIDLHVHYCFFWLDFDMCMTFLFSFKELVLLRAVDFHNNLTLVLLIVENSCSRLHGLNRIVLTSTKGYYIGLMDYSHLRSNSWDLIPFEG